MLYGPDNQPIFVTSRPTADGRTPLLASLREDRLRGIVDEWRKEASGRAPVALPPQDTLLAIAYWMYHTSGLYRAIIKNKTNVVCGDGFGWTAKRTNARNAVKGFWRDRVNNIDARIEALSDELAAFGELFLLCYAQKTTNRLRIGQIMPWNVERVITDPGNPQCPIGVKILNVDVTLPIISGPDAAKWERLNFSPAARDRRKAFKNPQAADGLRGVIYRNVNARIVDEGSQADGPEWRGTPDLFAATDNITDAENVLRDANERLRLSNRILYDVTLMGADQAMIDKYRQEHSAPPDAYAVNFHNERVTWNVQSPDMKAMQTREAYETARDAAIASGGAGQPPTWFAEGNTTTKASADSMPFPTLKAARRRQQFLGGLLTELTAYQLYIKGILTAEKFDVLDTDDVFALEYPTINEQDAERLMRVQTGLTAALNAGMAQGWLTQEEAARVYRSGLNEVTGVELDEWQAPTEQDAIAELLRAV